MLNFYGNKFTSKVNSFITKIKTEVKTLDRDNQRFIEDIFTKRNYHGYGEILQDNLINKFSRRENVKFEDIFPENIYPALEILIGEANLEKALDTAYLAFEDGLYCIFVNDEQTEKLEDNLTLKDGDVLTFIKLTMLAGRMW